MHGERVYLYKSCVPIALSTENAFAEPTEVAASGSCRTTRGNSMFGKYADIQQFKYIYLILRPLSWLINPVAAIHDGAGAAAFMEGTAFGRLTLLLLLRC